MSKKRSGLIKLSEKLLKMAPAIAVDGGFCSGMVGEPKLPKKFKKVK